MSSSGTFPDVLPEMNIKERNGEVSASIEETNRVRALLGLKPLNVCRFTHESLHRFVTPTYLQNRLVLRLLLNTILTNITTT